MAWPREGTFQPRLRGVRPRMGSALGTLSRFVPIAGKMVGNEVEEASKRGFGTEFPSIFPDSLERPVPFACSRVSEKPFSSWLAAQAGGWQSDGTCGCGLGLQGDSVALAIILPL